MAQKNAALKALPRVICLVGMTCCGKTSAGKALARLTRRTHLDTDSEFARVHGVTPAAYIRMNGEAAFRKKEVRLAAELLSGSGAAVISFGGGLRFDRQPVSGLLRSGAVVIWLKASQKTIAGRIAEKPENYPVIGETSKAGISGRVKALLAARLALYGKADFAVNCGRMTPEGIARAALERLARRTGK